MPRTSGRSQIPDSRLQIPIRRGSHSQIANRQSAIGNAAAALLTICLLTPPATAAARIPADKLIAALIRDLGAESYDARERATAALRQIGPAALHALEKAAESDDPEVRLRARDLVADARLGIGPDWPSEIVLLIRHYDTLQEHERRSALYRIGALGPKAVPFLVRCMTTGSRNDAAHALNILQQRAASDEVCQQLIRLIKEPNNEFLARALTWARAQRTQALDGIETLALRKPDLKLNPATEAAIQDIAAKLKAGKPKEALDAALALPKAAPASGPADPRPLYLQAEALIALNRDNEALALRDRALALNPDNQTPHYLAAELLASLGRNRLAAKEWLRVVEIPPNDTDLDTNAYLGLSGLHSAGGLFEAAAQYLDKALQRIAAVKDDAAAKALASALQTEVDRLRQRASAYPVPPDAALDDALPAGELQLDIRVLTKEGKVEDLQAALAATAAQLPIASALPNLPVLDLPFASLRYDATRRQLLLFFHDVLACDPLPLQAQGNDARVALHTPGATYIYKVDPATGTVERLARFHKTYTVALKPGPRLAALASPAVRINGIPYDWEKATDGIHFDSLPERFDIVVEGTAPLGRRITVRAALEAAEPPLARTTPAPK